MERFGYFKDSPDSTRDIIDGRKLIQKARKLREKRFLITHDPRLHDLRGYTMNLMNIDDNSDLESD